MSTKGSAYARFRRALDTGNLTLIRGAAAELPQVPLDDALRVCLLARSAGDGKRTDLERPARLAVPHRMG